MDFYDGTSWGVANAAAGESFAGFQSVGATLPGQEGAATGASAGPARTVTIAIAEAFRQPWLPSLPAATSLRFTGPDASAVRARCAITSRPATGVVPVVPGGLRYTVTITAPPAAPRADKLWTATPAPGLTTTGFVMPSAVTSFAAAHAGGAITPMGKVRALASYLQSNGRYSDGSSDQAVLAGNGEGRLTAFLQSDLTGDDEQYAAAMALLADEVGVPARVTLDAAAEHDGSVYGKDVHANVELDLAQYGWVTLPLEDFRGDKKPVPQPKKTPQQAPAKAVPQQQPNAAPLTGNNQGSAASRGAPPQPKTSGFHLPRSCSRCWNTPGSRWPSSSRSWRALRGAKAIRRRRRRSGPPVRQVAGAWAELVDLGRDLGVAPQPAPTRREQALYIRRGATPCRPPGGAAHASPSSASLSAAVAVAADAAIFGPADPSPAAVGTSGTWSRKPGTSALAGLPRLAAHLGRGQPRQSLVLPLGTVRRLALSRAGRAPAGLQVPCASQSASVPCPGASNEDQGHAGAAPPGQVDLVLTADADATVGDVADALIARDPGPRGSAGRGRPPGGRWADGDSGSDSGAGGTLSLIDGSRVTLDPELTLADSGIRSGARVAVGPAGNKYADRAGPAGRAAHRPAGAGRRAGVMLPAGNQTIGRQSDCDLRLSDTLVSRRHVRLFLAPGSAEILDLGSANGLLLNDEPATRGAWLPGTGCGRRHRAGHRVRQRPGGAPHGPRRRPRTIGVQPVPGHQPRSYAGHVLDCPGAARVRARPALPAARCWPPSVLMGGVLFAITRSPASLVFVALSPLMMIGNVLESRWTASRGNRASMAGAAPRARRPRRGRPRRARR